MESIGTLAGGIAHDLNNLLAPIAMGLDLLKAQPLDARASQIVGSMEVSAHRGIDLVKQVLSFARGVEGARVSVDVAAVAREVATIFERTSPRNVRLNVEAVEPPWPVLGDPTQIHQVLLNLCLNARDAMAEGGDVAVMVRNRSYDAVEAAANPDIAPGRYVEIAVTDTGCGIPHERMDRIFEPFYTTKGIGKGTGLGLSTALGIVRSHGGFMRVYSEVDQGTTFRVCLPARDDAVAHALSTELAPRPLPRGAGELILVVDDEISILSLARQTLEAFGYRVLTASDGAEALDLFAQRHDEIALVLTDVMMPGVDGPRLIAALRRIDPRVRVIASSGLATEARAALGSEQRFLAKPYTAEDLLHALRAALHDTSSGVAAGAPTLHRGAP